MAETACKGTSNHLREQGNLLYKEGKLSAAAEKYEEASKLADPNDGLPLSNLSAVLFELGNYEDCVNAAMGALEISRGSDERVQQKLRSRVAQAMLHKGGSLDADLTSIPGASDDPVSSPLAATFGRLARLRCHGSESLVWKKLAEELPRCKPALWDQPAWGRFGHDAFRPLFDDNFAKTYGLSVQPGFFETGPPARQTNPKLARGEKISFFF